MKIGSKITSKPPLWATLLAQPKRLIAVGLVLITLGIYAPVLQSDFVDYDDPGYVTENVVVKQGLTLSGVVWAFKSIILGNWHPVTWLSHMLDCTLFGLDPMGHHVINVLWHAANAGLLFFLLSRLTGTVWRSALVAALFAWHPLHVESVAWVSERKDVLSTFFGLLAILYYHRHVTGQQRGAYGLSLVFFAISLLAKPMLVTLPFVLLLLDYWPLERLRWPRAAATTTGPEPLPPADDQPERTVAWRDVLVEKLPYLALTVACAGVAVWTQKAGKAVATLEAVSLQERLLNVITSYATYLQQMIWPRDLIIPYLFKHEQSLAQALVPLLALLGVTAVAGFFRTQRYLLTGWCLYLGTLVPVIGLVHVGEQAHADRYTYIPLLGIFVMAAWGTATLLRSLPRFRTAAIAFWVLVLLACLPLTWRQTRVWRSTETLFSHTVAKDPGNRIAVANLAEYCIQAGEAARAVKLLQDFNRYARPGEKPTLFMANALLNLNRPQDGITVIEAYGRGNALTGELRLKLGQLAEGVGDKSRAYAEYGAAMEFKDTRFAAMLYLGSLKAQDNALAAAEDLFKRALAEEPGNFMGNLGLAAVNSDQGKFDEARILLQEAMRTPAFSFDEFYRFAVVQAKLGMTAEAEANYLHSIKRNRLNFDAFYNLGNLYVRHGSFTNAVQVFNRAVQLRPTAVEARNNLGVALASLGAWSAAAQQYREAMKLAPTKPDAYYGLARVLEIQTNWVGAATNYAQALKLKPDWDDARLGLALVLGQQERWQEAIPQWELFLKAKPASGLGHHQLGVALLKVKRNSEALSHLERAVELRPQDSSGIEVLARLLATAPEASVRNGTRAVALAERLGNPPDAALPRHLDTLAAAYAESGAFDKAGETGTQALRRAEAAGDTALAAQIRRHLELYKQQQPLRE